MSNPLRMIVMLPALLACILLTGSPATAANGHFVKASVSASGFGLDFTFKEAGLGQGTTVTIQASADYVAVFQCINGGNKNPSAANKSTESGTSAASGSFTSDKNGNVNGSLTLPAPSTSDNALVCPKGQREQLSQITWTNAALDDLTSGASKTFSGSWTFGSVL